MTGEWLKLHLAVFLFGSAGVLAKILPYSALELVFYRLLISSVFVGIFLLISRKKTAFSYQHQLLALLGGGVVLAGHWLTFFLSVKHSGVAIALLTYATFPVWIVFYDRIKGKLRGMGNFIRIGVAVGLGLIGTALLYPYKNGFEVRGWLWGIVSGIGFAALVLINRRYIRIIPAGKIIFIQHAAALLVSVCALIAVHLVGGDVSIRIPGKFADILLLLALGILTTGVAHGLYNLSLRLLPAVKVSVTAMLEPVYGIALARFVLHEQLSVKSVVGGFLIISAAASVLIGKRSGISEKSNCISSNRKS